MQPTHPQQRDRGQKRETILDATEQLLLRYDVHQLTIDQIATEAHIANGTIYLYFQTKEDIILGVVDRRLQHVFQGFGEALADASDGLDLIERMIRCEQRIVSSRGVDIRRLFVLNLTTGHSLASVRSSGLEAHAKLVGRIQRAWLHAVELGQQDGSIRSDVPASTLVAHVFSGLIGSFVVQWHSQRHGSSRQETAVPSSLNDELAARLIIDALRSGDRPRNPGANASPGEKNHAED